MKPKISIVVPLYNERESYPHLTSRLKALLDRSSITMEVVMVDDGSEDETALLMAETALSDRRFKAVFLARNYGHATALTAGLQQANGTEAVFIIDGDLQDPPELILPFYEKLKEGYDVVYGVRKKRKEGFLKRSAYHLFYRLLKRISYVDIPLDSGDFSMISRRVVTIINSMPEENRFLRGMRTWVGFKQFGYEYEREGRVAGESKYPLKMLFKLAYNGIFNFSEFPVKLISRLGIYSISVSVLYLIYNIIKKYVFGTVPEGFTALIFAITLFAGVQLLSLGIIGEYVLRIFFQVKQRPLFVLNQIIEEGEVIKITDPTEG